MAIPEEVFQTFYAMLSIRTLRKLDSFHYLYREDLGRFVCLDLNLEDSTLEGLNAKVSNWVTNHGPNDLLPCAPEEDWRKLSEVSDPRNHLGSRAIFVWKKFNLKAGDKNYLVAMERYA